MKIKKYVGATMSECILKVKRELGEDAVILDSRKVPRGGPFSFLAGEAVEVVAATPDAELSGYHRLQKSGKIARSKAAQQPPLEPPLPEKNGSSSASREKPAAAEFALISEDIRGLKETVKQITDHLKYSQLPALPLQLEDLHRSLLENGVEERIAAELTQGILLETKGDEFEDRNALRRRLHDRITEYVKWTGTSNKTNGSKSAKEFITKSTDGGFQSGYPRIIALVGPTGVGKTTTLAKMATHPQIFGGKRVALISADTYRIAAVEQLKTFAAIANIPMEAVYRPADMRRALNRFQDRDVILIDTAGRSQNDQSQLNDLTAFMEYAKPDEIHLTLSICTRLDDQMDVIHKFQRIHPTRLLFTKLDETTSFGMILNVCYYHKLPISLLTFGQNVPDDIVSPSYARSGLARLVSERSFFKNEFLSNINSFWREAKPGSGNTDS